MVKEKKISFISKIKLGMRGVGGPLLTIGDLLNDLGESDGGDTLQTSTVDKSSTFNLNLQPSDLQPLFQENYDQLKEALAGTDHSWTTLTLKLCTALDTANKLVKSSNSHAESLAVKVQELERVIKRGDSIVATAKSVLNTLNPDGVLVERETPPGSSHTQG